MNGLKSMELRKAAATTTAAIIGVVGLTGCGVSLSNPDMKSQDKATFEKILKPAAVKAARRVVRFVKKDEKNQTELSYTSKDGDVQNGYDIQIMGIASIGPMVDARMKGYKKNGKVVLLPETVYYIEADDTEEGISTNDSISQTEEGYSGVYHRDVWYAQGFYEPDPKGKNAVLASTHVDEPRNEKAINERLDYAKSVAGDFPGEVTDFLREIEISG